MNLSFYEQCTLRLRWTDKQSHAPSKYVSLVPGAAGGSNSQFLELFPNRWQDTGLRMAGVRQRISSKRVRTNCMISCTALRRSTNRTHGSRLVRQFLIENPTLTRQLFQLTGKMVKALVWLVKGIPSEEINLLSPDKRHQWNQ